MDVLHTHGVKIEMMMCGMYINTVHDSSTGLFHISYFFYVKVNIISVI